jgi:hypothetical protein
MTVITAAIPSLDAILRAQAARVPDAVALVDAPDCKSISGLAPLRLTYGQADRTVDAIAARLHDIGLVPGTVVGMQMPNVASGIITLLAIMRAGMVAAPLPLLWRLSDCVSALSASGARALVTCGKVAGFDHAALALDIAAELFPIRAVCGFGCSDVDGIVSFDDLLPDGGRNSRVGPVQQARARFGLVTFETNVGGVTPVARDTERLLAAGRLLRQRATIPQHATILTTLPPSSFAGVAAALVPWLLSGGTLVLHLPFDPVQLRQQIETERCDTLVVPDSLLPGLCATDWIEPEKGIRSIVAVWRAPERLSAAPQWTNLDVALVDVAAFGETALLAARRPPNGRTAPWPLGAIKIADNGPAVADVAITSNGTVGVRGPLAACALEPNQLGAPRAAPAPSVHVDTGFSCCKAPNDDNALVVTAPPHGLVAVGGYRFALQDLQYMVREIDGNSVLTALPHALAGHRLAGHASDLVTMRDALQGMGINPLLTAAFREADA